MAPARALWWKPAGRRSHRAVSLIHGALAEDAAANSARALKERRALPIELVCRKAGR